jgi:lysine-specific demethylase 8
METMLYFGLFFHIVLFGEGARQKPRGHLQYFGSHQPADGNIETLGKFPTPEDFYGIYVSPGIPVKFHNVLNSRTMPAFGLWTDEYLK